MELHGLPSGARFLDVLGSEYGTTQHPSDESAYISENRPFYPPRLVDNHISILSFNNTPLPDSLVEALVDHPELFPDEIRIRWTQEQDLILEATLGEMRVRATKP